MPEYDYDYDLETDIPPTFERAHQQVPSPSRWSPPNWSSIDVLQISFNGFATTTSGELIEEHLRNGNIIALPSGARYLFQTQRHIGFFLDGFDIPAQTVFEAFPPETDAEMRARLAQWGVPERLGADATGLPMGTLNELSGSLPSWAQSDWVTLDGLERYRAHDVRTTSLLDRLFSADIERLGSDNYYRVVTNGCFLLGRDETYLLRYGSEFTVTGSRSADQQTGVLSRNFAIPYSVIKQLLQCKIVRSLTLSSKLYEAQADLTLFFPDGSRTKIALGDHFYLSPPDPPYQWGMLQRVALAAGLTDLQQKSLRDSIFSLEGQSDEGYGFEAPSVGVFLTSAPTKNRWDVILDNDHVD